MLDAGQLRDAAEKLVAVRQRLRRDARYEDADTVRDALALIGVTVTDTRNGSQIALDPDVWSAPKPKVTREQAERSWFDEHLGTVMDATAVKFCQDHKRMPTPEELMEFPHETAQGFGRFPDLAVN